MIDEFKDKVITVLCGGNSQEREVSIKSGKNGPITKSGTIEALKIQINLNDDKSPKKSWELILPQGASVESYLSPGGILTNHNLKHKTKITSLKELSASRYFEETLNNAIMAFDYLLHDRLEFFNKHKQNIEKIVIGQRLGQFLNEQPRNIKHLFRKDNIAPVKFSFQREIAALGAAWKGSC